MLPVRETFPIPPLIIFSVPYLHWRLARTACYAPLVVAKVVTDILPGWLLQTGTLIMISITCMKEDP